MNNHNNIYLDSNNRWRDLTTKKLVQNPFNKRCEFENCDNLVRSKKQKMCSEHIDWTKVSHGSSLLTNDDVIFITWGVENKLSDHQISTELKNRLSHKNHNAKSILHAVRHHRRKYIMYRYDKKFYYKTIKEKYRIDHQSCEICGWSESSIDVHHILQIKDFVDEFDYHKEENMISLCPNHHRLVEDMRKENMDEYKKYISEIRTYGKTRCSTINK